MLAVPAHSGKTNRRELKVPEAQDWREELPHRGAHMLSARQGSAGFPSPSRVAICIKFMESSSKALHYKSLSTCCL